MKRDFQKHVEIKATDDEERVATGLVLTPWEVDHQRDYFTPAAIEAMFNPRPDDGVMHAAFPEGDAELVRNEVLEEAETIDGVEFDAGDWVVRRQYHNDDLWDLVERDILAGFSMGGHITDEERDISEGDLPDEVTFPEGVETGAANEVRNGAVNEISDVDIPAVPSATHAAKGDFVETTKNIVLEAEGEEHFVDLMGDRGMDEGDARDLWGYLQSATTVAQSKTADVTDEERGLFERFLRFLRSDDGATDTAAPEALDRDVELGDALDEATTAIKEGRPLNASNRTALMAVHDLVEDVLESDVDFASNRFSDNDDVEFTLDDYTKMTDDTDTDGDESPEWAKSLEETVESNAEQIEALNERLGDSEEKDADDEPTVEELQAEIEAYEASVDELTDELEDAKHRLDKLSTASAETQQLDRDEGSGDASGLDKIANALN